MNNIVLLYNFVPVLIYLYPSTNELHRYPAKTSFAASGFVVMVEVWLVCYLFVSVTKLPKKMQPCKKTNARIWSLSQMRALKKQNAAITLSGVWVFLSARPSRATSRLLPVVELSHNMFRKRVIIPVLIRSANIAPMMGTMRNGLTV